MKRRPWSKFTWELWLTDTELRLCSTGARGMWIDMLCIAAKADPYGYVLVNDRNLTIRELAQLTGSPESDVQIWLEELTDKGVFSRDRQGRIYSRKMVRDEREFRSAQKNGKIGGDLSASKTKTKVKGVDPPLETPLELEYKNIDSVSNETGDPGAANSGLRPAAKAVDPAKTAWDLGVALLKTYGIPERQARSLIGKWRKQTTEKQTTDMTLASIFIEAGSRERADIVAYIEGCLRSKSQPESIPFAEQERNRRIKELVINGKTPQEAEQIVARPGIEKIEVAM